MSNHWAQLPETDKGMDLDILYRLGDIRELCSEIVEFESTKSGFLAICEQPNKCSVDFAIFSVVSSHGDDNNREDDCYCIIMYGDGPGGDCDSLRECRHTWWGDSDQAGYIFYPNFELIRQSLTALERWFDGH